MGIIKGICISKERGTEKHEVAEAGFVKDWGIQGDAHAGKWHRQVSLLSLKNRRISYKRCRRCVRSIWRKSDRGGI